MLLVHDARHDVLGLNGSDHERLHLQRLVQRLLRDAILVVHGLLPRRRVFTTVAFAALSPAAAAALAAALAASWAAVRVHRHAAVATIATIIAAATITPALAATAHSAAAALAAAALAAALTSSARRLRQRVPKDHVP